METINATSITTCTLVGIGKGEFPLPRGNCFSVLADGSDYRILNFAYENMKEAINRGLTWPIKIKALSECHAIIHDERISDNWYMTRYCETCTPKSLLPFPQKPEISA